jgi:hypothetical protein
VSKQEKFRIMKKSIYLFSLFLTFSLIFVSCNRDDVNYDPQAAYDNALIESIFEDAQEISDEAAIRNESSRSGDSYTGMLSNCATITIDLTKTPHEVIVDFGTSNCLCNDGRFRRGKIISTFNGGYRDSGTVINHTFDDYYVNDHYVTGTKTVTNEGRNAKGNLYFEISVNGQVDKANNGGTITWIANRGREWAEGENTILNWADDVYLLTGSSSGKSSGGTNYTVDITKELRKEIGYKHIVSGILEYTPGTAQTRVIDYGDGTRDNKVTISIGSWSADYYLN